jgi:hypothetical protein
MTVNFSVLWGVAWALARHEEMSASNTETLRHKLSRPVGCGRDLFEKLPEYSNTGRNKSFRTGRPGLASK